jgi:hypothetical protein
MCDPSASIVAAALFGAPRPPRSSAAWPGACSAPRQAPLIDPVAELPAPRRGAPAGPTAARITVIALDMPRARGRRAPSAGRVR